MARANTLFFEKSFSSRSSSSFFLITGSERANSSIWLCLCSFLCKLHSVWYLYCFLPFVSLPVACKCPFALGHIQTCVHAGGRANDFILFISSSSVIFLPVASR